jgi:hypothetical protein
MARTSFNISIPISPVITQNTFYVPAPPQSQQILSIFGVTRDSSSNPLASCTVSLYRTDTSAQIASVVSDGSGNYKFQFPVTGATNFYIVAYKAGSPDVSGTTVNTLVGA